MKMKCKAVVKKVLKKTQAQMFKDLKVGDVVEFSIAIESVGFGYSRATHAAWIRCKNLTNNDYTFKSFNEIEKFLAYFVFEEVTE